LDLYPLKHYQGQAQQNERLKIGSDALSCHGCFDDECYSGKKEP
jgi:hypothetical protein